MVDSGVSVRENVCSRRGRVANRRLRSSRVMVGRGRISWRRFALLFYCFVDKTYKRCRLPEEVK